MDTTLQRLTTLEGSVAKLEQGLVKVQGGIGDAYGVFGGPVKEVKYNNPVSPGAAPIELLSVTGKGKIYGYHAGVVADGTTLTCNVVVDGTTYATVGYWAVTVLSKSHAVHRGGKYDISVNQAGSVSGYTREYLEMSDDAPLSDGPANITAKQPCYYYLLMTKPIVFEKSAKIVVKNIKGYKGNLSAKVYYSLDQ